MGYRDLWAYGITTVPSRRNTTLPRTIKSLAGSGFPDPLIFDRGECALSPCVKTHYANEGGDCKGLGAYGNWLLGILELWIRTPCADRYAMFQDDVIFCKGLRTYLNRCKLPEKGYFNLYSEEHNAWISDFEKGWHESRVSNPHHPDSIKSQVGKGALGYVFTWEGMRTLLYGSFLYERPTDSDIYRARSNIDGAVVTAMNRAGWREYIHNPSLCQHIGVNCSVMRPTAAPLIPSSTFRGEDWDATELLPCSATLSTAPSPPSASPPSE